MFKEGLGIKKAYIACGYTDLRYGVDGLAALIQYQFSLDPFDEGTMFLFCGRRADRIKGLLWEGDGFILLYKRLSKTVERKIPLAKIRRGNENHDNGTVSKTDERIYN